MGGVDDEIHSKMSKNKTLILVFKTYKRVKPHSSEESEDRVVERYIYNYDNDEYVYYFPMERSLARIQGWNGGWG